ncbi:MAG TPA: GLUG motif-containing protein [Rhizomicrobium sp.]|nr:GLUG motif-containing protein [Rhizomicrobium sp.]
MLTTTTHAAINISTQPTQNMSCSGGVCTATAQKAYLNVNDLTTMLAAGDLKVVSGAGAEDIHIQAPFSWTSTSRLTLDAQRSIEFEKPVSVAGTGALTLITNDGGTGGDYWFDEGASVTFWDTSSSLIINGQSFTLVKDIKTLALKIASKPSKNYALARDFNARQDGAYSASPISASFAGQFDGLGNQISNLTIKPRPNYYPAALFAELRSKASVSNLKMKTVRVRSSAGATALALSNGGRVNRVSASEIDMRGYTAAGLIFHNSGIISRATTAGYVKGVYYAGGLVGDNVGVIMDSAADVGVETTTPHKHLTPTAGGLTAFNWLGGTILRSSASGPVNGEMNSALGVLVGLNYNGSIEQSYATGLANGDLSYNVGGLVGVLSSDGNGSASIVNCYAIGPATSYGYIGGLVGSATANDGSPLLLTDSYSVGHVTSGSDSAGGFVGFASGSMAADYWDLDTSGVTDPRRGADYPRNYPGIQGLGDTQLKSGLPGGFDPQVWGQSPDINNGYPYLLANPPPKNAPGKPHIKSPSRTPHHNPAKA